jgi:hypothetical protein
MPQEPAGAMIIAADEVSFPYLIDVVLQLVDPMLRVCRLSHPMDDA